MPDDADDTREQGIEFGGLADDLEEESCPLSHGELLDRHGDHELALIDEQVACARSFPPGTGAGVRRRGGVRQAVFTIVGDEAVGREGYSDRGASGTDADGSAETDSV